MSLTDLKKKGSKAKPKKVSVEEFIDEANAYAKGQSQTDSRVNNKLKRNFKNATFTLTPQNIEQLQQLNDESDIAKSKLVRCLINYLHQNEEFRQSFIANIQTNEE